MNKEQRTNAATVSMANRIRVIIDTHLLGTEVASFPSSYRSHKCLLSLRSSPPSTERTTLSQLIHVKAPSIAQLEREKLATNVVEEAGTPLSPQCRRHLENC